MMGRKFQPAVVKISVAVSVDFPRGHSRLGGSFPLHGVSIGSSISFRAGRMDQRRRMYKTLGCLAGAMTGTASLLAWIDPSPPTPTPVLSQEELLAAARSLVFDDVTIRPMQWRSVEVVEAPSMRSSGVALAADADRNECHFYVDDQGRPSRAGRWDDQLALSDAPHTIRIEVSHNDALPFPSAVQSGSVQALLDALEEAVTPAGSTLQIRFPIAARTVHGGSDVPSARISRPASRAG